MRSASPATTTFTRVLKTFMTSFLSGIACQRILRPLQQALITANAAFQRQASRSRHHALAGIQLRAEHGNIFFKLGTQAPQDLNGSFGAAHMLGECKAQHHFRHAAWDIVLSYRLSDPLS